MLAEMKAQSAQYVYKALLLKNPKYRSGEYAKLVIELVKRAVDADSLNILHTHEKAIQGHIDPECKMCGGTGVEPYAENFGNRGAWRGLVISAEEGGWLQAGDITAVSRYDQKKKDFVWRPHLFFGLGDETRPILFVGREGYAFRWEDGMGLLFCLPWHIRVRYGNFLDDGEYSLLEVG